MEALAAGTVVLVRFPFSDLSQTVLRPAVVLAGAGRRDFVLCQITSNPYSDRKAVELTSSSFQQGSLDRISYARPGKLFTASTMLMDRQVGLLTSDTHRAIVESVISLLQDHLRQPQAT